MTETPESYADSFPDRLMEIAANNPFVQLEIKREYAPLLAADLYRGSVLMGHSDAPFEGSLGEALMKASQSEDVITLQLPAPMARTIAVQIKVGGIARRGLH